MFSKRSAPIPLILLLSNQSASAVKTKHFGLGFFGDDDDMGRPFAEPFGLGNSFFGGHRGGSDPFFSGGFGGGFGEPFPDMGREFQHMQHAMD